MELGLSACILGFCFFDDRVRHEHGSVGIKDDSFCCNSTVKYFYTSYLIGNLNMLRVPCS